VESQGTVVDQDRSILNASWRGLQEGVINFRCDWPSGTRPRLLWGADRLPLLSLRRAPLSDYGNHSGYFVDRDHFSFVLRADRFEDIDLKREEIYVAGDFNGWAAAIGQSAWRLRPRKLDGAEFLALRLEHDDLDWSKPHVFKFVTGNGRWLEVAADATNAIVDEKGNRNYRIRPHRTGRHRFFFRTPLPLARSSGAHLVHLDGDRVETVPMQPGVFLKQLASDLPLGVELKADATTFRLFAPRASRVRLFVFRKLGEPAGPGLLMHPNASDGTVWELTVPGRRAGWYYHFRVEGEEHDGFSLFDPTFDVLDPYAKACVGPLGPGIVVDEARLAKTARPFHPPAWHDLVIVEVHLRDLLAQAPIDLTEDARKGYRGLTAWLREEACYLRELGVNAVELQPIHEFDTVDPDEYGWGYMPVNYFSPASQYAADPRRASQVEEFRALVEAFHEADLAVILDVVYNHVGDPNYLQFIDKGYYFLLNADGEYMNYSGCGNTIDPDTPMARRLMADSLIHFLETYDVDGFRFDLGELLGIDCLRDLEERVKAVKPGAFLVAEPWSFRSHFGPRIMETGVAAWNDGYREFMKDYVQGKGSIEGLRHFMQGSRGDFAGFPAQTVNYLCSHDDRVWIDKITERPHHDGTHPTPNDRRRTHLALATLMCSVGIPMLHGGDDFLYSKGGRNNTYLDGPANVLPYDRLRYFSGTHAYTRAWIQFRLSAVGRVLRLDGHPDASYFRFWSVGMAGAMLFNACRRHHDPQILFAINPTFDAVRLPMEGHHWRGWVQWGDHERLVAGGLPGARIPLEEGALTLTGQSCAIWVRGA
jgi:pullulanase